MPFQADFIARICEAFPDVVGLKWWSDNACEWFRDIETFSDRLSIVSNMPSAIGPSAFLLGAHGYVSQAVNAAPRQNVQIVQWLQSGQYKKAMAWICNVGDGYYKNAMQALNDGYSGESNYVKGAMDAVGFPCGPPRLPNRAMPQDIRKRFEIWASAIGALEKQEAATPSS